MSHLTNNTSFGDEYVIRGRVFPANHLATVLKNQTYDTQNKQKNKQLNLTKPN